MSDHTKGRYFMGRKGGRMFQRRRERTKREQEFWEARKREEQIYQTEKERNKEHESESAEE